MTMQLAPYGTIEQSRNAAKVGGKNKTPLSLAARMPSVEIAAKVGTTGVSDIKPFRIVRRNARS